MRFLYLLMPGSASDKETWLDLQDYDDWIETASDEDLRENAQRHYDLWDKLVQEWQATFNPKVSWEQIAEDVVVLEENPAFSWETGPISHGWLAERIDCSQFGLPEDLPYHANVGTGYHALGFAIEEDFLLRDAILLLIKARQEYEKLDNAIKNENQSQDEFFNTYNNLAENIATYSRLAVLSLFAFIECFVNSISEDFLARNREITFEKNDVNILQGFKLTSKGKESFFSIQNRMEKIPAIIRGDQKYNLLLSDSARRAEPFNSFFGSLKKIRDSTTHHAKRKEDIIKNPEEWMSIAEDACDTCLKVASLFWIACYPNRPNPVYLDGLDKAKYISDAKDRHISEGNAP